MANKETKVIIAVPCADSYAMKALTAHAIGCAIIAGKGLITDFLLRVSCDIVSNRTWLVNEAIKNGGTHILFVDCDIVFGMQSLETMLAHDKAVVGAEYNKREFPLVGTYKPLEERSETELYEAAYVGTGLMLIDLQIFKTIKGPWFNFGRDSQGALAMGEDVWFCNTVRETGYKVWIDPTIRVKHIGDYAF